MSNLTAVRITDKNGKKTTVHKRLTPPSTGVKTSPPRAPRPASEKPDERGFTSDGIHVITGTKYSPAETLVRSRAMNDLTLHLNSDGEIENAIDRNNLQVFRGFETDLDGVDLTDDAVVVHLTSTAYSDRDSGSSRWEDIGDPERLGLDALDDLDELTEDDAARIAREINQQATDNLTPIEDDDYAGLDAVRSSIADDLADEIVDYESYSHDDYDKYRDAVERTKADLESIIEIRHTTAPYDIIRAEDISDAWDEREVDRMWSIDLPEERYWASDWSVSEINAALIERKAGVRRRWTADDVRVAISTLEGVRS